jgi:uncharacterized protein YkwD
MRILIIFAAILQTASLHAQADKYLAAIPKYNEASSFEDERYRGLSWKQFYALEEVKEFVDPMNYDSDLMNAALFFAINKYRDGLKLSQLTFEPRLRDAAMIHSNEMVKRNFFDHVNSFDPKIRLFNQRTELCGFMGEYLSENISRTFQDMNKPLSYTELADRTIKELSTSNNHKKCMTRSDINVLGCGFIFERKHTEGIFYFRTTHDFAIK